MKSEVKNGNKGSRLNIEVAELERSPERGKKTILLDRKMSPTTFLKIILVTSVVACTAMVAVNVSIDIYGLFRSVEGRAIPVYNNDRISKYLLSFRYIPENFNAAILGTSLSANIDVNEFNQIQNKIRIYNASVMGANISELSPVANNLIKGGIKKMIICFSPYMTKNSGSKEVELGPKIYYGAFGSKNLFETYAVAVIRQYELMPQKFPKDQIDACGVNHYQAFFEVNDVRKKIESTIEENRGQNIPIDPVALQELKNLIALIKANNVQLVGYFHPVPDMILESKLSDYENFEQTVRQIIGNDFTLIDLNDQSFSKFTSDYTNYIDHGHLSQKGQKIVSSILFEELIKSEK